MDFQDMAFPKAPVPDRRSKAMALASVILGIVALVTCCCIYLSIVCGSLGIILALLSKGGELTMDTKGQIGLTLSSVGLGLTLFLYIGLFLVMLSQYGGIDGILQEYMRMYQADTIEELYQMLSVVQ